MWNSTGTVTVTNGSPVVTGAGTVFSFPNAQPGQAFVGPNGLPMEIASVDSASQITLARAYGGASAAGQPFTILPTQSFANDLALAFAGFKNVAGAMLDTIGQGMFPDGSLAAPGLRFSADQDTGFRRVSANALSIVTGGFDRLIVNGDGNVGIGTNTPLAKLDVQGPMFMKASAGLSKSIIGFGYSAVLTGAPAGAAGNAFITSDDISEGGAPSNLCFHTTSGGQVGERMRITPSGNIGCGTNNPATKLHVAAADQTVARIRLQNVLAGGNSAAGYDFVAGINAERQESFSLYNATTGRTAWTVDGDGNFLAGLSQASTHTVARNAVAEKTMIFEITNDRVASVVQFFAANNSSSNSAAAAMRVSADGTTGRSINAAGTINAGGADYAEYVRKSPDCGRIQKGDPCGIDRNGELTRTWADSVRYVVKSTDPNLVGGDTWAAHVGPQPSEPLYTAPAYNGPAEPTQPVEPAAFVPPVIDMPVQPVRADGEEDETYLLRLAAFLNDRNSTIVAAQAAADAEVEAAKAQVAYAAAADQYQADLAAYRDAQAAYRTAVEAAEAAHAAARAAHAEALTAWEAALEAARQTVDRIAFSGQVPVNVDADTLAACEAALGDGVAVYLVAAARGAGIGVAAVRETDMTLPLYMRRLGAVWAIRDGRPWIDVQHG